MKNRKATGDGWSRDKQAKIVSSLTPEKKKAFEFWMGPEPDY